MTEKLKLCPFCGGKPMFDPAKEDILFAEIFCTKCYAKVDYHGFKDKKDTFKTRKNKQYYLNSKVKKLWNRRIND